MKGMQRRLFSNLLKSNFCRQHQQKTSISYCKLSKNAQFFFSSVEKNDQDLQQMSEELEKLKVKAAGTQPQKKSSVTEEQLQELSQFESFQSASRYASLESFQLAETQFQEVLTILNEKHPERIDLQLIVMKRIALMMKIQDKNNLLTPLLEDLYFKHLAFYSYKNVDYIQILKNLLTHYCIHDLDRGSLFLEMLLEQLQQQEIPKVIIRDIYLYAGIIHSLKGEDFDQAERFFQESIQAGLQPIQKGIAYNNLACVTYWNCLKLLLALSETPKEESEKAKQIQLEIQERIQLVAPLLKRAFNAFEFEEKNRQKDQINENQFTILKKLFDEDVKAFDLTGLFNHSVYAEKIDLLIQFKIIEYAQSKNQIKQNRELIYRNVKPEDILLKNPMSSVCAMNMGEFLFYSGDFNASQFWLQVSQYSSTKLETLPRVLRTIVLSSSAAKKQNKVEFAESLIIDCLEYSENYITYNKVFALEQYSSMLKQQGRNYEGDSYLQQAENLKKQLSYWDERKENIIIPEYDFKF